MLSFYALSEFLSMTVDVLSCAFLLSVFHILWLGAAACFVGGAWYDAWDVTHQTSPYISMKRMLELLVDSVPG